MTKKYSASFSKTNKWHLLEDNHFTKKLIAFSRQKPNNESLKNVAELLNEKEDEIERLKKENEKLEWYYEELRVHVPKETLELIDSLWNELKGGQ